MASGTAVRIQTLDSSLAIQGTLNFERYEVLDGSSALPVKTVQQDAQNGQPTFFILQKTSNLFQRINIDFRIHGNSTLTKLRILRDWLNATPGNLLRVYPKLQSDESVFYDCFANPSNFPEDSLFSGEYKGGETVSITFTEVDKSAQSIVIDDVIVE